MKVVFGLFKKTDPICGMKEEKGKGTHKHGKWFCSDNCLKKYKGDMPKKEEQGGSGCCH